MDENNSNNGISGNNPSNNTGQAGGFNSNSINQANTAPDTINNSANSGQAGLNVNQPNTTPMNSMTNQNTPMGMTGGTTGNPMMPTPPKKNSKMIAIVAVIVVALLAIIITLVIMLMNNNSSKSQSGNKGGSHYEEDDDKNKDKENDTNNSISSANISCLGYSFKIIEDYEYDCQSGGLMVQSQNFAMYLEVVEGMSYYQAEGNADLLASSLEESGEIAIKTHRQYTASTGRKMIVFDATYDGVDMYIFVTSASSSAILIGEAINSSARPTTADLETAANILDDSTVASRLPNDETEDNNEGLPEIDWSQHLKAIKVSE